MKVKEKPEKKEVKVEENKVNAEEIKPKKEEIKEAEKKLEKTRKTSKTEKIKEKAKEKINKNKKEIKKKIDEKVKKSKKKDEQLEPKFEISMWRLAAYFIVYSFVGSVIAIIFALFNYGVLESRKSFLYGPFCSIYGVGAVIIILALRYKFFKNNHTLFLGGFIVGSVVEYIISFLGEAVLNVKWWDYSDRFLNINGRICLLYSLFWGLLGIYLLRVINPRVDRLIDWIKSKININIARLATALLIVFLFVDCLFSTFAIDMFLLRVSVEKNLPVKEKAVAEETYRGVYGNKEVSDFIYKYIGNEKMLMTYPNLTITLEDGSIVKIKDYYPDVRNCYYRFDTSNNL